MKHRSTRDLFAYWNKRRGERLAPERADIEPSAIRQVLGDTFVLEGDVSIHHPFRLAGTRLCALFCRELKGESFTGLWRRSDQNAVRELLTVVTEEQVGIVAQVTAATADDRLLPVDLELLLLPLAYRSRAEIRVLGAMTPMAAPYWMGAKPAGALTLGMFRHVGPAVDATIPPRLRVPAGRLRHGLTVYDGGRLD
jgi:hypothetical protein